MAHIKIEDCEILEKFLNNTGEDSCENSVINFLVWQNLYNINFELFDEGVLIFSISDNKKVFRLPFFEDFEKGFNRIKEYSGGKLPIIWTPDGTAFRKFKELYGDRYEFTEDRDGFDYIYLKDDLANLPGKKYHSKRNHIANFEKNYKWKYEPIDSFNKSEITECLEKWYQEYGENNDENIIEEKKGILFTLDNMERLKAKGGAVFVDGKAVAFSIGSPINSETFDIHFEKALNNYNGAYSLINREFVRRETNGYTYINREDDLGIDGLRKAKLSYKPFKLLKKYLCIPRYDIESEI